MLTLLRMQHLHVQEDFLIEGGHPDVDQVFCTVLGAQKAWTRRTQGTTDRSSRPGLEVATPSCPWPEASVTLSAAQPVGCYGRGWLGWVLGKGASRGLVGETATGDVGVDSTPGPQCRLLHLVSYLQNRNNILEHIELCES